MSDVGVQVQGVIPAGKGESGIVCNIDLRMMQMLNILFLNHTSCRKFLCYRN